jgi:hypothetical protein
MRISMHECMNRPEHSVYAPMVPQKLATESEVEAMHAKLAARSAALPLAPSSEVGESRNEKSALKWLKPTSKLDTAVKTECGTYSCAKVVVMGISYYELWQLIPERKQLAKRLDNFLQAQKLAQIDADKGKRA